MFDNVADAPDTEAVPSAVLLPGGGNSVFEGQFTDIVIGFLDDRTAVLFSADERDDFQIGVRNIVKSFDRVIDDVAEQGIGLRGGQERERFPVRHAGKPDSVLFAEDGFFAEYDIHDIVTGIDVCVIEADRLPESIRFAFRQFPFQFVNHMFEIMTAHVDSVYIGLDAFKLRFFLLHQLVQDVDLPLFFTAGQKTRADDQNNNTEDNGKDFDNDGQRCAFTLIDPGNTYQNCDDRYSDQGYKQDVPPDPLVFRKAIFRTESQRQKNINTDSDRKEENPFPLLPE